LFSSSKHGWKRKDWIKAVKGNGQTITFFKSPHRLAGGYLDIPWEDSDKGKWGRDH
jgi:16S rRNA C1402 (ribose-2'-O) methylase RsmI